jgi:CRP-like cAMP-binding protein
MGYKTVEMLSCSALGALLKTSFLASIESKYIQTLQAMMERGVAESGDVIRVIGEVNSALYIDESREIQLRHPKCAEPFATLHAGDAFGMLSLLFPIPNSVEAVCTKQAKFIVLEEGTLRMIELSQPQLAVALIRAIRVHCAPSFAQLTPLLINLK